MNYPTTQSSLLERVQNGDEISWNEFYFRYAPVIRAAGAGFHFNDSDLAAWCREKNTPENQITAAHCQQWIPELQEMANRKGGGAAD